MSSTNRGAERHKDDYYQTPSWGVEEFLNAYAHDFGGARWDILDPCAGGRKEVREGMSPMLDQPMPYPEAIRKLWRREAITLDIRPDSPAAHHGDFLALSIEQLNAMSVRPIGMAISNPPFSLATQFVDKALQLVPPEGHVIFLGRLNLLGSDKRRDWWQHRMPANIYVHSKRMGFREDGKTDSIEYAHFLWIKGYTPKWAKLRVI